MKATVLLVEEDADLRSLLGALLEREGYEVLIASSPGAAFPLLYARRPNAIVVDVRLPPEPCFDLIRDVKALAEFAHLPVIILTGDDKCLAAAEQIGATASLRRPQDYKRLLATVNEALFGRPTQAP